MAVWRGIVWSLAHVYRRRGWQGWGEALWELSGQIKAPVTCDLRLKSLVGSRAARQKAAKRAPLSDLVECIINSTEFGDIRHKPND